MTVEKLNLAGIKFLFKGDTPRPCLNCSAKLTVALWNWVPVGGRGVAVELAALARVLEERHRPPREGADDILTPRGGGGWG